MAPVQTVLGPVEPDALGKVLVHEHVRIAYPGDHLDPAGHPPRDECVAVAVERMHQVAEHGVKTFVDPCPIDLGRDPELLAEVAEASGMNIVCATGFYHEEIGIPWYWRVRSAEEVAELYLHEIQHGIGNTGIRPGVIKIATADPVGDHDRKVLAGAAMAAAESGLPVITHCENSVGGDVQQDALAAAGVDLARCLIGHQDHATDSGQHVEIAQRGSFVGIDRIGLEILTPEATRVDHIRHLVDAGYGDWVCLSQDHMCCLASPKFPYPIPEGMEEVFDQIEPVAREQMYGRAHSYLFTDFLPRLAEAGVDGAVVEAMLTDNPRRLLAGV
jgi:phosphotriesterase-related protein